jgi:hypothetical protein
LLQITQPWTPGYPQFKVATELAVFSFVWGAFETIAKIVDPASIPKALRTSGADGLVVRVIYGIKDVAPFPAYDTVIAELRSLMCPEPPTKPPTGPPNMGRSGIGLDVVRRMRNRFARHAAL